MLHGVQGTPQVQTQQAPLAVNPPHSQARKSALTQQQLLQTRMTTPVPPAASAAQTFSIGGYNPNIQPDTSGFPQSMLDAGYSYAQILEMMNAAQRANVQAGLVPASAPPQIRTNPVYPLHPIQQMFQLTIPQLQAQAQAKAAQQPIPLQLAALQQQALAGMTTSTSNTSLAGLSSIVGNYDLAGVPTLPTLMAAPLTASAAAANTTATPIAKPAITLAQMGNKALVVRTVQATRQFYF